MQAAVEMQHIGTAGPFVQIVHVLRHDGELGHLPRQRFCRNKRLMLFEGA